MPRIDLDQVIWNEVDGNVVILQFATGAYFTLNGIASDIWRLLDKGNSNEEIISKLQESYDVPLETLQGDVTEFITKTTSKGLTI